MMPTDKALALLAANAGGGGGVAGNEFLCERKSGDDISARSVGSCENCIILVSDCGESTMFSPTNAEEIATASCSEVSVSIFRDLGGEGVRVLLFLLLGLSAERGSPRSIMCCFCCNFNQQSSSSYVDEIQRI